MMLNTNFNMKTNRVILLGLTVLALLCGREAQAFYNPTTGRWLNRDPIGESGGPNLHSFAGNTPPNAVDPLGLRVPRTPEEAEQSVTLYFTLLQQALAEERQTMSMSLSRQAGYCAASRRADQLWQAATLTGAELQLVLEAWQPGNCDCKCRGLLLGRPESVSAETSLPQSILSDITGPTATPIEAQYQLNLATGRLQGPPPWRTCKIKALKCSLLPQRQPRSSRYKPRSYRCIACWRNK